jgi:hypothetical protein
MDAAVILSVQVSHHLMIALAAVVAVHRVHPMRPETTVRNETDGMEGFYLDRAMRLYSNSILVPLLVLPFM